MSDTTDRPASADPPVALPGLASRLRAWIAAAPSYAASPADLRTVEILGLRLPLRATVAVLAVSLILLLDYHGRIDGFVDAVLGPFGEGIASAKRVQSLGRLILEGLVPLALVVLVLRDRPSATGCEPGTGGRGPRSPWRGVRS